MHSRFRQVVEALKDCAIAVPFRENEHYIVLLWLGSCVARRDPHTMCGSLVHVLVDWVEIGSIGPFGQYRAFLPRVCTVSASTIT